MIEQILQKYNAKINHANQVKTYSLMIFDSVNKKLFDFNDNERKYLETASMLHDIGYYIESKSHHKHSLDLILSLGEEEALKEFSQEEIQIIAHLARYHRSSFPDESKHKRFSALNPSQKDIVLKLSPILRLADGLDNPHKNLITGVEFQDSLNEYTFFIRTVGFAPKLKRAQEKKEMFESIYKKPLNLVCKKP